MNDPRTLELLDAELDGTLSPAERVELDARIAADPDAATQRDQLARMAGALARLPAIAPDPVLRARILEATTPRLHRIAPRLPPQSRRPRRTGLRIGIALAASLAAVAIGVQLSGLLSGGMASRDLVATMGHPAPAAGIAPAPVHVRAPGLEGTVSLRPDGGAWQLVFALDSARPVRVTAAYPPEAFRLTGDAGTVGATALSEARGRLAFESDGARETRLRVVPAAGGDLQLRFDVDGVAVGAGALRVPPAGD